MDPVSSLSPRMTIPTPVDIKMSLRPSTDVGTVIRGDRTSDLHTRDGYSSRRTKSFTGSIQDRQRIHLGERTKVLLMTAYEITQDLLDATTADAAPAKRTRKIGRVRGLVTAGVAAGALILAAPAASAATATAAPSHSAISEANSSSTLPSTITLTTRRTGSVIL